MDALGSKSFVALPQARYAVWTRGKGPLVVLLHGWPVTSYRWRFLVPALEKVGFQTLAIDLKGLGESTGFDTAYDKKTLAQEILQVLATVAPKASSFRVVGHDWGGSVALGMAAVAPEAVARLVVEDEVPPGVEAPLQGESLQHYSSWHGAFHRTDGLAEALIRGHEDIYLSYFLGLRGVALTTEDREVYLKHHRSDDKTAAALAYYRTVESDSGFYGSLKMLKLKAPVLTIAGSRGMGASVAIAATQIASNVSSHLMEGIGHYPAEEAPDEFNRRVLAFLKG